MDTDHVMSVGGGTRACLAACGGLIDSGGARDWNACSELVGVGFF